ncbi:hypothetical protein F2P56_006556 [Juglans regia]|uniref:Cysteine-rich receptor-like protein kinase 25 n=2 Tax=Juglans regia TaxID=51240 RepID=A0A2I4GWT0_JUGRE|nr:cysteine-rich receptor-like protein kinase 25 [Juglans regia]KAF5474676.1 hypothetical protein F2P56_006556 [Juglans regia]
MFFLHNSRAFLFLLLAVCTSISSINSLLPTYNDHSCLNRPNQIAISSYISNQSLATLLDSLSTKASQSNSFYNDSNGGIYGLFLCRGDVSNDTCRDCVNYATKEIRSRCEFNVLAGNRSAIIWYDECMLRYSDSNFFGEVQTEPKEFMWNAENTTSGVDPYYGAKHTIYALLDAAVETDHMLFKADKKAVGDGTQLRYGLVQCTRDLNATTCRKCFNYLMTYFEQLQNRIGWRILAPSCSIRYENYRFFDLQSEATQPPPPPPTPPAPGVSRALSP